VSFIGVEAAIQILEEFKRQLNDLVEKTKRKLENLSIPIENIIQPSDIYAKVILARLFISREKFKILVEAINTMSDREL